MVAIFLPPALTAALDARTQGRSQTELARRAETISQTYRKRGTSQTIQTEDDSLAYALARMPATYAACIAALNALTQARPDFVPRTLLDCGAGPGSASWAAQASFASLREGRMIDANPALRALAFDLAQALSFRLQDYVLGDALALIPQQPSADLVIASYVLGELTLTAQTALVEALWARTTDTLLLIEPGTPNGYRRILAARDSVIAAGGLVAAPCPHEKPCPLTPPDWCHFRQRLPRSRVHRALKAADAPFEDEKFSYVIMTRTPPSKRAGRIIVPPVATKPAIAFRVCEPNGIVTRQTPRRDKAAFRRHRHLDWSDAMPFEDTQNESDGNTAPESVPKRP